ncbi:DUF6159 family protein [Lysobacter terrae]
MMFDRFSRSWELAKASAAVLRSDKELMLFPIISGLLTLVVLATFLLPVWALRLFTDGFNLVGALVVFAFYFCQYAVILFCNCALVGAAMIRLDGGDPTLADGFNAAKARLPAILGYAAIAATVGLVLKRMKDDDNLLMRILGSGLGAAWTLATFLVVPVLVSQNVGPIDALKQSASLLKRTWGENAIGNVGIGVFFGLLSFGIILIGALLAYVAAQVSMVLAIGVGVVFVIALLLLGVYQAALSGIYSAALYRFATQGEAPAAFRGLQLEHAFQPK